MAWEDSLDETAEDRWEPGWETVTSRKDNTKRAKGIDEDTAEVTYSGTVNIPPVNSGHSIKKKDTGTAPKRAVTQTLVATMSEPIMETTYAISLSNEEATAKLPAMLNDFILSKCENNEHVRKSDFDGTAREALQRISFLQALQAIEHFASSVSSRIQKRPAYLMGILRGQEQHWDKSRAAASMDGGSSKLLSLPPQVLLAIAELCLHGNVLPSDFTPEVCLSLHRLTGPLAVKAINAFNSNKRIGAGQRGGVLNRPRFFQRLIQNVAEQNTNDVGPANGVDMELTPKSQDSTGSIFSHQNSPQKGPASAASEDQHTFEISKALARDHDLQPEDTEYETTAAHEEHSNPAGNAWGAHQPNLAEEIKLPKPDRNGNWDEDRNVVQQPEPETFDDNYPRPRQGITSETSSPNFSDKQSSPREVDGNTSGLAPPDEGSESSWKFSMSREDVDSSFRSRLGNDFPGVVLSEPSTPREPHDEMGPQTPSWQAQATFPAFSGLLSNPQRRPQSASLSEDRPRNGEVIWNRSTAFDHRDLSGSIDGGVWSSPFFPSSGSEDVDLVEKVRILHEQAEKHAFSERSLQDEVARLTHVCQQLQQENLAIKSKHESLLQALRQAIDLGELNVPSSPQGTNKSSGSLSPRGR